MVQQVGLKNKFSTFVLPFRLRFSPSLQETSQATSWSHHTWSWKADFFLGWVDFGQNFIIFTWQNCKRLRSQLCKGQLKLFQLVFWEGSGAVVFIFQHRRVETEVFESRRTNQRASKCTRKVSKETVSRFSVKDYFDEFVRVGNLLQTHF